MIDPDAIDAWLSRPLRDSERIKKYTRKTLLDWVASMSPVPVFELEPRTHQLVSFVLATRNPGYYLALDMGAGKTFVAANVMRWRMAAGQVRRTLVLVPGTPHVSEWRRELALHAPEISGVFLDKKLVGDARSDAFWSDAPVVVATYRGFLMQVGKSRNGAVKLDDRLIAKAKRHFDMLILDESTAIANHEAVTARALMRCARTIPYRLCMSGTPFDHPMELWSQFYVVDRGDTLHETQGFYREAFFSRKDGDYAPTYTLRRRLESKLHRMLRHGSLRYETGECLDLPPVSGGIAKPIVRDVLMTKVQARHVIGLEAEMEDARVDEDSDGIKNVYHRMRCISSGYIPTEDGPHAFAENPKASALLELIREAPTEQWVVFLEYKDSADLLHKELQRARLKAVEVSGRVSNKAAALDAFRRGDAQILVTSKSGMMGLNLQHCQRSVYYECPDSIKYRKQGDKRTHRMGQQKKCFIYDLVVRGTYDARILQALRAKKRVLDVVVDGVERQDDHVLFA